MPALDLPAVGGDNNTWGAKINAALTAINAAAGAANGVATLDAGSKVPVGQIPIGTSSTTVAAGDDSRITGSAQKASNLSDLTSAATALANLGAAPVASPLFTGGIGYGTAPSARMPVNLNSVLTPAPAGTTDKIGQFFSTTVTGDFSTGTGTDPTFAWGMNFFGVTGPAANDGKGGSFAHLVEFDIAAASGTIAHVTGLQAEASFISASAGATVSILESLRVASPKRKNGATAGTATAAYGLFVESFDGTAIGAGSAFAVFVEGGLSRFQGRIDLSAAGVSAYGGTFVAYANAAGDGSGASLQIDSNSVGGSSGSIFANLNKTGSTFSIRDSSAAYATTISMSKAGTLGVKNSITGLTGELALYGDVTGVHTAGASMQLDSDATAPATGSVFMNLNKSTGKFAIRDTANAFATKFSVGKDGSLAVTPATTTTAPAAGAAGALPATPAGYFTVTINGTAQKVAFY